MKADLKSLFENKYGYGENLKTILTKILIGKKDYETERLLNEMKISEQEGTTFTLDYPLDNYNDWIKEIEIEFSIHSNTDSLNLNNKIANFALAVAIGVGKQEVVNTILNSDNFKLDNDLANLGYVHALQNKNINTAKVISGADNFHLDSKLSHIALSNAFRDNDLETASFIMNTYGFKLDNDLANESLMGDLIHGKINTASYYQNIEGFILDNNRINFALEENIVSGNEEISKFILNLKGFSLINDYANEAFSDALENNHEETALLIYKHLDFQLNPDLSFTSLGNAVKFNLMDTAETIINNRNFMIDNEEANFFISGFIEEKDYNKAQFILNLRGFELDNIVATNSFVNSISSQDNQTRDFWLNLDGFRPVNQILNIALANSVALDRLEDANYYMNHIDFTLDNFEISKSIIKHLADGNEKPLKFFNNLNGFRFNKSSAQMELMNILLNKHDIKPENLKKTIDFMPIDNVYLQYKLKNYLTKDNLNKEEIENVLTLTNFMIDKKIDESKDFSEEYRPLVDMLKNALKYSVINNKEKESFYVPTLNHGKLTVNEVFNKLLNNEIVEFDKTGFYKFGKLSLVSPCNANVNAENNPVYLSRDSVKIITELLLTNPAQILSRLQNKIKSRSLEKKMTSNTSQKITRVREMNSSL
jgi:hypothetical protein